MRLNENLDLAYGAGPSLTIWQLKKLSKMFDDRSVYLLPEDACSIARITIEQYHELREAMVKAGKATTVYYVRHTCWENEYETHIVDTKEGLNSPDQEEFLCEQCDMPMREDEDDTQVIEIISLVDPAERLIRVLPDEIAMADGLVKLVKSSPKRGEVVYGCDSRLPASGSSFDLRVTCKQEDGDEVTVSGEFFVDQDMYTSRTLTSSTGATKVDMSKVVETVEIVAYAMLARERRRAKDIVEITDHLDLEKEKGDA